MKILSIIIKCLKEQIRSFWVLLLTLSMGPFFIFLYFLMIEASKQQFDVLILNEDKGVMVNNQPNNHGNKLIAFFSNSNINVDSNPFKIKIAVDKLKSIEKVKNKKADILIIIDDSFSQIMDSLNRIDSISVIKVEFIGDLTNTNYLICAAWIKEIINEYTLQATQTEKLVDVKETALGTSASINEFDMMVPGILIISLIMLMFTASIAFVSEVENRTILRLKLSKISTIEFLGGIGFVQLLVGIVSILFTLLTAILLGFEYQGSFFIMIIIACLTSLSMIAFSLIIAALTKSANEVLVVGNFPMLLFMFFTGAAFPINSKTLFTIAGYSINIQGLMTPTHAISALKKTLIMNMDFTSIIPELISILLLTILYFIIGAIIFKKRHLKLT